MRGAVMWAAVGCAGCAHPPPEPFLAFAFEARPTAGEIRVVPALQLHPPVTTELGSFVGRRLPERQARAREQRTRQLSALSGAVGLALPGEVNGELGDTWAGEFQAHGFPLGVRQRVTDALRSQRGVDAALADAAMAIGGDAVLLSWMDRLEAEPLTLTGILGTVVDTPVGPLVVDSDDEPYLVSARVGMALVTGDGEVVIRYHDTFETVLSGARGPQVAGRDLAHALAAEVAKVWSTDPRLREGEPAPFVARANPGS
jgi:hypothetical protein